MVTESLKPAAFGGYGRQIEKGVPDPSRGGLLGQEFSSLLPPDIQPNTRIVALCGITDFIGEGLYESSSDEDDKPQPPVGAPLIGAKQMTGFVGMAFKAKLVFSTEKCKERNETKKAQKKAVAHEGLASPVEDGWFFSDFYLFHHLFRSLGANQRWITRESPKHLVEKYSEYGHGGAMTDHRIVLNKNVLGQMESDNNIQVFKRADLLQGFLRTFAGECQIAAEPRQPVLLMVFGHGDSKTYGIAVGGSGAPRNAPRLRIHEIAACLNGLDIFLTVLLTSCFSRGWVLQPELNISAFTAVGPLIETRSWGNSLGDRCHGSINATAVRKLLSRWKTKRQPRFVLIGQGDL